MATLDVIVVGAAGAQAQAMLEAASRGGGVEGWLALDRSWSPAASDATEALGASVDELDLFEDGERLRALAQDARLVANFAGPYYRTGDAVLDACIDAGCDYLDICDDADATLTLLDRDEQASSAGVRALIGMGSSPGVTNVLVRAAVDHLGGAERVDLAWVVDVADVGKAALQHFWHIFVPVASDGSKGSVPAWSDLNRKRVAFPDPLGEQLVIELSHPEPITVPRFLDVESVHNFGSIAPDDALVVNWSLARLGASETENGTERPISDIALELYDGYLERREDTSYLGGGLVVDVIAGDDGLRFASADETSMEESTGIPAAAGIDLLLNGGPERTGVFAPECLAPADFFTSLGKVSRGTGSLALHRTKAGKETEKLRIRDLLSTNGGER